MPPKKRNKRLVDASLRAAKVAETQRGVNTSGFAVLPAELHAEIISHFPRYPVRCEPLDRSELDNEGLDRQFTLHALSRTCSAMRAACLPFLSEGIEVYEGFKIPRKGTRLGKISIVTPSTRGARNYAEELLRQLEVVTVRNPALTSNVKFMNVTLAQTSLPSVGEELLRCLGLFPNIITVRMAILQGPRSFYIPESATFPQVRTLLLNGGSAWLMRLFPNARNMSFSSELELSIGSDIFSHWLSDAQFSGTKLEVLGLVSFDHHSTMWKGDISQRFPALRDVTLECYNARNTVATLSEEHKWHRFANLRDLQTIRIRADLHIGYHRNRTDDLAPKIPSIEEQQEWCKWAKSSLLKVQTRDKLEKRVYFKSPTGECKLFVMRHGVPIIEMTVPSM